MRPAPALAVVLALGLAAACSRHDDARLRSDLKGAGHDVRGATSQVAQDSDVRGAEAQLRAAGHDAAADVRKAAREARAAAHALAADARHAGHDVTRSSPRDARDSSS